MGRDALALGCSKLERGRDHFSPDRLKEKVSDCPRVGWTLSLGAQARGQTERGRRAKGGITSTIFLPSQPWVSRDSEDFTQIIKRETLLWA